MGFKTTVKVYYEDTDAGGMVYHSNYLNFAERARTDLINSRGIFYKDLEKLSPPIGLVVHSCTVNFKRPARLGDILTIDTVIENIAGASFDCLQNIYKDERLLVEVRVKVVCVASIDGEMKLQRIPENIRELLKAEA